MRKAPAAAFSIILSAQATQTSCPGSLPGSRNLDNPSPVVVVDHDDDDDNTVLSSLLVALM